METFTPGSVQQMRASTVRKLTASASSDWYQLVHAFKRDKTPLYVAGFPSSQERTRDDHFFGLPREINRSLTTYRLYKLFEPWPRPILPMLWNEARGEGRLLEGGRLEVQLQPLGQAQMWRGDADGVLWETYIFGTRRGGINWLEELTTFWQAVERDMDVPRIFTQPHEPTFAEGYPDFLSRLGYAPDPDFDRWWSKRF